MRIPVVTFAALLSACTSGCFSSTTEVNDGRTELGAEDAGEAPTDVSLDGDFAEDDGEVDDGAADDGEDSLHPPEDIRCGNGTIDAGEECDDGNRMNGDGCDWLCRLGPGEDPPELPVDPSVGRAVGDLEPTPVDLGVEAPGLFDGGITTRIPLVYRGDAYATVWSHAESPDPEARRELTFVRFDGEARVLSTARAALLASGSYRGGLGGAPVEMVHNGSAFGVLWAGRDVWPPLEQIGISFAIFDDVGSPMGPVRVLSRNGYPVGRLGLAWNGTSFLCTADAWDMEDDGGDFGLLRLDSDGDWMDPRRHLLARTTGYGGRTIAAHPERALVAWEDLAGDGRVAYAVVGEDGVPYGWSALGPVAGRGAVPCAAASDDGFGVAWVGEGAVDPVLWFARFNRSGELLAPPRPVPDGGSLFGFIDLVFAHGTYVVGWFEPTGGRIIRLDRNGTLVERVAGWSTTVPLEGSIGIAADDDGIGMIGARFDPEPLEDRTPVFTHFRVVR